MLPWQLGQLLVAVPVSRIGDALRVACPQLLAAFEAQGVPAAEVATALLGCLPAAFALRFDEIRRRTRPVAGAQTADLLSALELLGADGSIHNVVVGARVTLHKPWTAAAAWRGEPPVCQARLQLALGYAPSGPWEALTPFHEGQAQVCMSWERGAT